MSQKPFFSIIIPTLNEAKYLPHLLSDLTKQSFTDFEVIVVDGHSEDKTVNKAQKYSTKLSSLVILNSDKRHVCVQRNLGAQKARANTFIFMDADNRLPSYFLQGIKYHLESSTADIITTRLKPDVDSPTNRTIASLINTFLELQNDLKPFYLLEAMIIIKAECFHKIGGFDQTVHYAEGKSLIQSAIQHNYTTQYFRDPIWTYSFRRFRKFGVFGLTSRAIRMELAELLGIDPHRTKFQHLYPMQGGSFFQESKRQALLAKLQSRLSSVKTRNQFLNKLDNILSHLLFD